MEDEYLYRSIYEYLMVRIYFGYYPKGEYLPSIHKLGNLFGVSTITVRSALRLLEQEGYISTQKNKRTVILPDPLGPPKAFPGELLLKEEIQQDLHRSLALVFPRIFCCGLSLCREQELSKLYRILERPGHSQDEPTVNFLAQIIKGLKNSLALDLYYDVMLFSYPSCLAVIAGKPGSRKQSCENLLRLNRTGGREALLHQFSEAHASFCPRPAPTGQHACRSTPYRWHKPQTGLSTVTNLIRHMIRGTYPAGSFLPSARILAEESSTALITMRRAIVLLNDLGITETINGRGTRILLPERGWDQICWDKPAVRKHLMFYLEALHLLAITCRNVAEICFPRLSPQHKARTLESARLALSRGRSGMILHIYLDGLVSAMDLAALGEIYSQLLSLLTLGLPLSCLKPRLRTDRYALWLAAGLEGQDPRRFAVALEQLVEFTFLTSREMMVNVGIHEAARLVLPPGGETDR